MCCFRSEVGTCQILTIGHCVSPEPCSFFKTKETQDADIKKSNLRLCSLANDEQLLIAGNYYRNKCVWKESRKAI